MNPPRAVLAVVLLLSTLSLAVAVVPGASVATDTGQTDTHQVVDQCATAPPADFADPEGNSSEVVGWVEGYWYDEPVNTTIENGLNESELNRLSARTAARIEAIRCLTVQDGLPPVDIVPREEFATDRQSRSVGETARLVDNAKFETTLTIDSRTDATDVQQNDSAERVGGFYNFVTEEIVIVTDDPSALRIDESTLAEELGHAIQDQQFDLSEYDRPTVDRDKGILGLIEGDIGLVVDEYRAACADGRWSEPCLTDQRDGDGGGGGPEIANWGLYFEQIHPYSDGPSFIQETKATGGWDAVNALYDEPPTSALHVTYPDTLETVELTDPTVPDRSTDAWERIVLGTAPDSGEPLTHNTLGISVITGMFAAPAYEGDTAGAVLPRRATLNTDSSGLVDQFNPHEYAHPETEGWRGDSLYTYRGEGEETATVWRLAWASAEDADLFVEGYEQLVGIRGGERVDGYAHTYTFNNETDYDIALTLVPDGDRVTVVTAPTVEALTDVDQQLELLPEGYHSGDPDGRSDNGTTGSQADGTTAGESDDGTADAGMDDGAGGNSGDDQSSEGADGGAEDDDGGSDTALGVVILPAVGLSVLILLALLSTGRGRGL